MGKCGQAEKQQQMRTFWPVPATSADVMAMGEWEADCGQGKGKIHLHRPLGLPGAAGQVHAFREGQADFCKLHGGAFPGEALGQILQKVRIRKG